jgi:hypothetical protein
MKTALSVIVLCIMVAPVTAQWLHHPTPGIPRSADGKPNLMAPAPRTPDGKPDLSGIWDKGAGDGLAGDLTRGLQASDIAEWARKLAEERSEDFGKGHMSVQCLPFGPGRRWLRPFRIGR